MNNLDVSILMCTYNRAVYLRDVLQRLVAQTTSEGFRYEIVVVDNGSSDETASIVKLMVDRTEIPIRYVYSPEGGVHEARNRSLKEGRGRWFAFIDDDELPEQDWLARLHSAARETGAKILGGTVLLDLPARELTILSREVRRSLRERYQATEDGNPVLCGRDTFPGTDNLLVDRRVFEEIGNFDETMVMGGADHDLILRARQAGFEPWYVPNAIVYHRFTNERLSTAHLKRDAFGSGVLSAFLRKRYHGPISVILAAIVRLGHGTLVTLPSMGWALLSRDSVALLDRRIKWWRMSGFFRYALLLTLPWLPTNEALLRSLDFRNSRIEVSDGNQEQTRAVPPI